MLLRHREGAWRPVAIREGIGFVPRVAQGQVAALRAMTAAGVASQVSLQQYHLRLLLAIS
jgi:hypothetical protein